MKILIVDDNANNRMLLNVLLQDYGEIKNEIYEIEECENGLEAVAKAKVTHYDIIFMDIMMPQMDGIEATKRIHHNDRSVMIIAVSAVDDELKQNEILRNGAEDYVPKPIDSKLLNARLDNYFSLLKLRKDTGFSKHTKAVNLYTNEIFKRQTIFYIDTEEALAEFWEYYLLRDISHKLDGISDVVRTMFSLGEAIISQEGEPWIIVEGDNDAIYFTINKIEIIGEMVVKLVLKKNKEVNEYLYDEDKLSLKLLKVVSPLDSPIKPLSIDPHSTQTKEIDILSTNVDDYQVFDYMDRTELSEMQEQLGELSSLMLILGTSEIEENEVLQIAKALAEIGRNLTPYTESYIIGQSLISLSQDISLNTQVFEDMAYELSSLSAAFVSDLESWAQMTFYEGAPSVSFMNDTIVSNTQIISALLTSKDEDKIEDMDDIFDF